MKLKLFLGLALVLSATEHPESTYEWNGNYFEQLTNKCVVPLRASGIQ